MHVWFGSHSRLLQPLHSSDEDHLMQLHFVGCATILTAPYWPGIREISRTSLHMRWTRLSTARYGAVGVPWHTNVAIYISLLGVGTLLSKVISRVFHTTTTCIWHQIWSTQPNCIHRVGVVSGSVNL